MPTYTFLLFDGDDTAISLDAIELSDDGATLARASALLEDHRSCTHVEVWDEDRAVMVRHREQPVARSLCAQASSG